MSPRWTGDEQIPKAPDKLEAVETNTDGIMLRWTSVDINQLYGYRLECSKVQLGERIWSSVHDPLPALPDNTLQFEVSSDNITPYSVYDFCVKSVIKRDLKFIYSDPGRYLEDVMARKKYQPFPPRDVTVTNILEDSVQLKWKEPIPVKDVSPASYEYVIEMCFNTDGNNPNIWTEYDRTEQHACTIKLHRDSGMYRIRVSAQNKDKDITSLPQEMVDPEIRIHIKQKNAELGQLKQLQARMRVQGATAKSEETGSIIYVISCHDMSGLRELWMNYMLGNMEPFFQDLFALEANLDHDNSDKELDIEIDVQDFYDFRQHLLLTCPNAKGFRVVRTENASSRACIPKGLSEDYPVYYKPLVYNTTCSQLDFLDPAVPSNQGASSRSTRERERSPGTWQRSPGIRQRPPGTWQRSPGIRQRPPGTWQRSPGISATVEKSPMTVEELPGTVEKSPMTVEELPGTVEESPGAAGAISPTAVVKSSGTKGLRGMDVLRLNHRLLKTTIFSRHIMDYLIVTDTLTMTEVTRINAQATEEERMETLLFVLARGGDRAFKNFCMALKKVGVYRDIAEILEDMVLKASQQGCFPELETPVDDDLWYPVRRHIHEITTMLNTDKTCHLLMEFGVMTKEEFNVVQMEQSHTERAETLFRILFTKGRHTFQAFLQALRHIPVITNVNKAVEHFFISQKASAVRDAIMVDKKSVIVLYGSAVSGKTQIALWMAQQFQQYCPAVVWKIDGHNKDSFLNDMKSLLSEIKGDVPVNESEVNSFVAKALDRQCSPTLLIVDDIDDGELICPSLLKGKAGSKVLITTRNNRLLHSAKVSIPDDSYIHIKGFEEDEGVLFLQKQLDQHPAEELRSLVKTCNGLPLSLAAAHTYINRTHISVANYLILLKDRQAASMMKKEAYTRLLSSCYEERKLHDAVESLFEDLHSSVKIATWTN